MSCIDHVIGYQPLWSITTWLLGDLPEARCLRHTVKNFFIVCQVALWQVQSALYLGVKGYNFVDDIIWHIKLRTPGTINSGIIWGIYRCKDDRLRLTEAWKIFGHGVQENVIFTAMVCHNTTLLIHVPSRVNVPTAQKVTRITRFIGPAWAPCWSHELCYLGNADTELYVSSSCNT